MPTNLPPTYFEAEKRYKAATTPEEKVSTLEELLALVPKHKGTEKLQAQLKTKIAKFKNASQKKSSTAKHGASYKVKKSGAGQVALVGLPNAGKSMLARALSGTELQVSASPYTTHAPCPAMMKFENIQVQLLDMPPATPDFMEPWYPDNIKSADAALIIIDLADLDSVEQIQVVMENLKQKKIELVHTLPDESPGSGWVARKTMVIANKTDLAEPGEDLEFLQELMDTELEIVPVSAERGEGLEELRKRIFLMLEVIRVYSKIPGKKAEMDDPFTLKKGATVMDMASAVHKEFAENLKFARIWSEHSYDGQRVNRKHVLEDEDIIELHM